MKEIKSLLQQAEVYRDQGLLQEAMEKYNIASELILKNNKIKNRQNLIHVISKKMGSLENDFKKKNKPASRKMPKKTQELIKSKKFFAKQKYKKRNQMLNKKEKVFLVRYFLCFIALNSLCCRCVVLNCLFGYFFCLRKEICILFVDLRVDSMI